MIVIVIIVLSILIGLATPFANTIRAKFTDAAVEIADHEPKKIGIPQNIKISNDILTFDSIENADSYRIKINSYQTEVTTTTVDLSAALSQFNGEIIIDVAAVVGGKVGVYSSVWYKVYAPFTVTKENREEIGYQSGNFVVPETFRSTDGIWYKVVAIGDSAFYGCSELTDIRLPKTIKTIGEKAFYGCMSLVSITLPEGITNIGELAFINCMNLRKITLPSTLTGIGSNTFDNCSNLRTIVFNGTKAQWNTVELGDYWNINAPAAKVDCSNGSIFLS